MVAGFIVFTTADTCPQSLRLRVGRRAQIKTNYTDFIILESIVLFNIKKSPALEINLCAGGVLAGFELPFITNRCGLEGNK